MKDSEELLILFFALWLCIILVTFVWSLGKVGWQSNEEHWLNASPTVLYNNTKMNMFGCIVTWVGITLINPLWRLLIQLPTFIVLNVIDFFTWLFTVGREN